MLIQLTIQNFAIVEQLDIMLQPGMTVITGETGAGKSIMLDALGLALGDRADKDVIRQGADKADICARFVIDQQPEVAAWLADNDLDSEGECLLRRVIASDGRSRAYINGQATTLAVLKSLGELLIDIHSQHEHQSLLRSSTHQRLLDDYCGHQALAEEISDLAQRWRDANNDLQARLARQSEDSAQRELLGFQLNELEALHLEAGEFAQLEDEHQRLHHAGSLLSLTQQALDLCSDNEEFNIQQALSQVQHILSQLPHRDQHSNEALAMLENALIQVEEAGNELNHAINAIELDPERLEEVEQRMRSIHQLARKHRLSPDELPAFQTQLQNQLDVLDEGDSSISQQQQACQQLLKTYHSAAARLSEQRQRGAERLAEDINHSLSRLGMGGARISLALNTEPADTPSRHGYERCEFLISTNPGQAPRPLIKIASGGELSRVSLAIQVATAQTSTIPTLVFDEVDVGIGGGVAKTVGELLRHLGDRGQVICVTHQAQVASQGHHHLYVSKRSDDGHTSTRITALDDDEKVTEVARMLGGDDLSDQSLAHAREMMA